MAAKKQNEEQDKKTAPANGTAFIPSVERNEQLPRRLTIELFQQRQGKFDFTGIWTGRDISYVIRRLASEYRLYQRTLRRTELAGLASQVRGSQLAEPVLNSVT